jgi:Acetyl/propionyl-CoA carboxylase, alpha subunit
MKSYTITVNGVAYAVTVEEGNTLPIQQTAASVVMPVSTPVSVPVPVSAPISAPVSEPQQPQTVATGGVKGSIVVSAPMPGKILGIKVSIGQAVNKGDTLLVLEAMKMENEIVAPEAGTIASIDVSEGANVQSGDVLVTMN